VNIRGLEVREMNFPLEFREKVIAEGLSSGKSYRVLAEEFGVGYSTLGKWLRDYRNSGVQPLAKKEKRPQDWSIEQQISLCGLAGGYWLLRYWQFFHDLRDRGIAKSYTDRLENLVPSAILKRLDKTGQLDTYAPDIDPKSRIYTLTGVGNTVSPYTASLTIKIESADGNSHLVTAIGEHTISRSQVPLERLQALFHVTVRTRLGTEFILPFVIASVPLIVLVYMHWPRN
jgi:hypothetical protein